MNESYREEHPLLCDEISDEELRPSQYQRGLQHMKCSGRSKHQIKGAATVIARWPEHWSSSVTYWWTAIGMISITFFIIYNSVVAFALLPSTHLKAIKPKPIQNGQVINTKQEVTLPEVFMHLFTEHEEDKSIDKYLPYIEIIRNKYINFKYKIIIIVNDTQSINNTTNNLEENNEIALNSLWSKDNIEDGTSNKKNIVITHVTLSEYMDNSPVQKFWRHVPPHFVKFLARAVSVWDKGGIAFNPDILTPRSPNPVYIEKLQNLLQIQKPEFNEGRPAEIKSDKSYIKKQNKLKKRVNNIRDIINALENNNTHEDITEENLVEDENKVNLLYNSNDRVSHSLIKIPMKPNDTMSTPINVTNFKYNWSKDNNVVDLGKYKVSDDSHYYNTSKRLENIDNEKVIKNQSNEKIYQLFPIIRNYLLQDKSKIKDKVNSVTKKHVSTIKRKSAIYLDNLPNTTILLSNSSRKPNGLQKSDYKPIITLLPKSNNLHTIKMSYHSNNFEKTNLLTIDLKGNIIATRTPCHAFLGSVFSNVIHHSDQETLTEFIITELSSFCKGLLSTCNGIDVILL